MSYRAAKSLGTPTGDYGLFGEINKAAPNRSLASDGWIGDPSHASRASDHNPNSAGVVRAIDITDDDAHGVDVDKIALRLAQMMLDGSHPALKSGSYLIRNWRIFSYDRRSEGWRPYSISAHDKHLHVSVSTAASGYDSTVPWNVMEEEDPMADYEAQLNRIERKIDAGAKRDQALRKALKALDVSNEEDFDALKRRLTKVKKEILADTGGTD